MGIPLVLSLHTRQDMLDVAIEEWMAASPLYSLRTQRALAFGNADVPTIFKNIQLDIGAPHQFMDFRYKVDDPQHGEFWLAHCGALDGRGADGRRVRHGDVPRHRRSDLRRDRGSNQPVREGSSHPPPARVPSDREPHCHWRVVIDPDDGEPVVPHPTMAVVGASEIAACRDRRSRP